MKKWEKDTKLSSFTKDAIVPTEPTPLQAVSREGSTGGLQGVHENQLIIVSSNKRNMK